MRRLAPSLAGLLAMRDEPRPDAKAGIDALAAAGIGAVMLTGDNARTAQAVARAPVSYAHLTLRTLLLV